MSEEAARRSEARERSYVRGAPKKMVKTPARRELVHSIADRGLSDRHALRIVGMSASAYRYQPAPDQNQALRGQIVDLAQRHRRYGTGMIYLKLRQAGHWANHKRVERLYAEAGLQVQRRRRKMVPLSDRQALGRPRKANQGWPMDFVFYRTAKDESSRV